MVVWKTGEKRIFGFSVKSRFSMLYCFGVEFYFSVFWFYGCGCGFGVKFFLCKNLIFRQDKFVLW